MKRIIYSMFLLTFFSAFIHFGDKMFTFILHRMINTGHGGRRTMWRRSARGTPGAWRRTRSPSVPPSWSGRTPRCDRKWPSCGKTSAAARRSCRCTRPNTARCEGHTSPRTHISLPYDSHRYSAGPCGRWTRATRAIVFLRRSRSERAQYKIPQHDLWPLIPHSDPLHHPQCGPSSEFRAYSVWRRDEDGNVSWTKKSEKVSTHEMLAENESPRAFGHSNCDLTALFG